MIRYPLMLSSDNGSRGFWLGYTYTNVLTGSLVAMAIGDMMRDHKWEVISAVETVVRHQRGSKESILPVCTEGITGIGCSM